MENKVNKEQIGYIENQQLDERFNSNHIIKDNKYKMALKLQLKVRDCQVGIKKKDPSL